MSHFEPSEELLHEISLYHQIEHALGEPERRRYLAALVEFSPYGAQSYICKECHMDPSTIKIGREELKAGKIEYTGRQRKPGGGRKSSEEKYPQLQEALRMILDGETYGDPCRPLSWTTLSLRKIQKRLEEDCQIVVSVPVIEEELDKMGYSRQNNRKMLQTGKPAPNRDEQFQTIADTSSRFLDAGDPVISVDTKKKENLGNMANHGTEYRLKGCPREVLDHDFLDKELGQVAPYGVYLVNDNLGFVNLGTSKDTSDFATESIRRWWYTIGRRNFPEAKRLYITCDCGGSNSSRGHLWKYDLAELAEETGLELWVSHFPPGTSKWNKVEHRLFGYISKSWQGKPLIDIETVVELIRSTTTTGGLKVDCVVDHNVYETGKRVLDEDMARIDITQFGNDTGWNYVIRGFKH